MTTPADITIRAQAFVEAGATGSPRRFKIAPAYSGDKLVVAGFYLPVVVDLAGLVADPSIVANLDHDMTKRVGHVDDVTNDGTALALAGPVSAESAASAEFVASAEKSFPWSASIEASVQVREEVPRGKTATANGRSFAGPVIIARKSKLFGIAILSKGADATARAVLASKGNPMSSTNNQVGDELVLAERERITKIENICAGDFGTQNAKVAELRAAAVDGELSYENLRFGVLDCLRAGRQSLSSFSQRAPDRVGGPDVLEAAFLGHLGHENVAVAKLGERVAQQGRDLRCHSFVDIVRAGLKMANVEEPVGREAMIRAAFSTVNLPGILSNAANKMLLDSYNAFPSVARVIARKLTARNFKDHTGYRSTNEAGFREVGATGEIEHGTLAESSFTYAIKTFGRMFGVSRRDMINDDLGAFAAIPNQIGRSGATLVEETFWTLVLANASSFFGTGNDNYDSGSDTALDAAGLSRAVAMLMGQTDANGKPISVVPKWLVTSPSQKGQADRLYAAATLMTGGSNTSTSGALPAGNEHFGRYLPLVSAYINNASYTGSSDTLYYLWSDPNDVATAGIAFLNDQESPTVETEAADFSTLGIQFRGYLDVGACLIDSRGAVLFAGA